MEVGRCRIKVIIRLKCFSNEQTIKAHYRNNDISLYQHSHNRHRAFHMYVQSIPLGMTFPKAQGSNISFHWNVSKEMFELSALQTAFKNVTPSGTSCICLKASLHRNDSILSNILCVGRTVWGNSGQDLQILICVMYSMRLPQSLLARLSSILFQCIQFFLCRQHVVNV